jgi:hypothetical protein
MEPRRFHQAVISFARSGSGFLDDPQDLDLMPGPNFRRLQKRKRPESIPDVGAGGFRVGRDGLDLCASDAVVEAKCPDGELADCPMFESQEPDLKIKKLPGANRDIHEIREAALW